MAALNEREWLAQQFESLTSELHHITPSEWAESKRYLPPGASALPGPFRFAVTPYLREIVDCLSSDSPVRFLALMKGVQLGFTIGVLENAVGYFIEHVANASMMMLTADAELAKLRLETSIIPMLQLSELGHLVRSSDEDNSRKTGRTDKKIEWVGGGFLIPFGAQNANKLRSIPIQIMLRDEIDAWPDVVGKDGDPLKLSEDRTATYEHSRKILDISTPLIKGQSKIEKRFAMGDQRKYYVCCLSCGFPQELRWSREANKETGEVSGIVWETDGGRLVPDSVRYLCQNCHHAHTNDDKTRLLSPDNGAEWRPTATPSSPHHRSYHLSALYSPVGMQSWSACVQKWLDAWDVEHHRPKDMGQLQVFYNNVLGECFELRGEKLRFDTVSAHRRHWFQFGQIANTKAVGYCGSPVLLVTCAVDVHKENLAVAVFGWCKDRRAMLLEYERFEGDTEQLDDERTWGRLRTLIETKEYVADDGKIYKIEITLIDSGYRSDDVYRFAESYNYGVYPVKGRDVAPKASTLKEFSEFTTPMGTVAYGITVDLYKDRWSSALKHSWDDDSLQPPGHFNAPLDATDKQLKELTVEVKRERIDARTGQRIGFEWHRPSGAANELWDLLVYNNAALDLVAYDVCRNQWGLDIVDWHAFYERAEQEAMFFRV